MLKNAQTQTCSFENSISPNSHKCLSRLETGEEIHSAIIFLIKSYSFGIKFICLSQFNSATLMLRQGNAILMFLGGSLNWSSFHFSLLFREIVKSFNGYLIMFTLLHSVFLLSNDVIKALG